MAKILIVDDDREIRFFVRKALEKEGYNVVEAGDGKECLGVIRKQPVDLVLMDVMMPGMDGWEVARRIREDKSLRSTKIVMLTVRNGEQDMEKSFQYAGSDGHLNKPFVAEQLLSTIKWILTQNRWTNERPSPR